MDYTVWQESHMLIECLLNYFRSAAFTLKFALWSGLENIVIFSKISKIFNFFDIFDFFNIFDIYIKYLHIQCPRVDILTLGHIILECHTDHHASFVYCYTGHHATLLCRCVCRQHNNEIELLFHMLHWPSCDITMPLCLQTT